MAIRYRTRAKRLEHTIARIEAARRAIAGHRQAAANQQAWWRRHGTTLTAWRGELDRRYRREPAAAPTAASAAFAKWVRRRRLHPAVLRLRLECWWLTMRTALKR